MRFITTDRWEWEAPKNCAYCNLSTGWQHESHCPLFRKPEPIIFYPMRKEEGMTTKCPLLIHYDGQSGYDMSKCDFDKEQQFCTHACKKQMPRIRIFLTADIVSSDEPLSLTNGE